MDLEKAIRVLTKDILTKYDEINGRISNKSLKYNIYDYNFSEAFPNINIIIFIYPYTYGFQIVKNPECNLRLYYYAEIHYNKILHNEIADMVKIIYNLKNDYEYSKIMDEIVPKKTKVEVEEMYLAKLFITHQNMDECCVCYEPNCVKTICKHSLCRECVSKLIKYECPMCKVLLTHYD